MATVAVALFVIYKLSDISDLEEGNAAIRDALSAIAKHRDEYLDAKARNSVQEARIGDAPPQLAGDLEAAARAENIQIAESSERPTVPAGRRYVEHDTDLKIRETDLQSLTNFLKRVETGPRLIFFTRLALKHPYGGRPRQAGRRGDGDRVREGARGQDQEEGRRAGQARQAGQEGVAR